jgi:putative exporter of polyketide antibiotics
VFLIIGLGCLVGSVFVESVIWSSLLAVTGAASLWGIGELFQQRKRVDKGWFPSNPNRLNHRRR